MKVQLSQTAKDLVNSGPGCCWRHCGSIACHRSRLEHQMFCSTIQPSVFLAFMHTSNISILQPYILFQTFVSSLSLSLSEDVLRHSSTGHDVASRLQLDGI